MISMATIGLLLCSLLPLVMSANDCLLGESFWCGKFENAVSCSAVPYCVSTVWNKSTKPKESECQDCIKVLKGITEMNEDEMMKEVIKSQVAENICTASSFNNGVCTTIVKQSVDDLLLLLSKSQDFSSTCQTLDYCADDNLINSPIVQSSNPFTKVGNIQCSMCKKMIDAVKKAIGSNPTKKKIEEELAKACHGVPKLFRKVCEKTVKKFTGVLIDMLLKKMSSEAICKKIHLCKNFQFCPNDDEVASQCETCEVVVRLTQGLIESNISDTRSIISNTCSLLPCKYQSTCLSFEEIYEEQVIELLREKEAAENICSLLKVCKTEDIVSGLKCIEGPDFWCSSPINAKLCQAEEYCTKYVWI